MYQSISKLVLCTTLSKSLIYSTSVKIEMYNTTVTRLGHHFQGHPTRKFEEKTLSAVFSVFAYRLGSFKRYFFVN